MKTLLIISLLPMIFGCSIGGSAISEQISAQIDASRADPIDLSVVGPASWERVCVLFPYTTNQAAEQVLGFKWDAESRTSIAVSEGINVLVFVKNQQVVAYTEHPRNKGDFSKLRPQCLPRSASTVKREESGADGWIFLVATSQ